MQCQHSPSADADTSANMPMPESAGGSAQSSEWFRVADGTALPRTGDRLHTEVHGRFVSVLRGHAGALHCMDSICYHTGGPLAIGDIEEVNGELCIRCPWHDYSVRLADGAKPYQSMKFDPGTKKLVPDGWKYTRQTQRTHEAVLREGAAPDGGIWVRLSTDGKFESDQFAYNSNAAKNVARGDRAFAPDGKSLENPEKGGPCGYKRSGEVIAEMRAKASTQKMPPPALLTQPATLQSLHPVEWRPFRLLSKKQLAGSMWLFRFALPPDQQLGWASLRHVQLRLPLPAMDAAGTGPAAVEREYTPVSPLGRTGSFDLAVKIYPEGTLTPRLAKMAPGQLVDMRGPLGDFSFSWSAKSLTRLQQTINFESLLFVVAGSGVTPAIQVLQDWIASGHGRSQVTVTVVYSSRSEDEIAFLPELRQLAQQFVGRFRLHLAVSQPTQTFTEGHRGRIDEKVLGHWLGRGGAETVALICGPAGFNDLMKEALRNLGFANLLCL
ncbi:cyb5r1 [Symbiodinium natans]|uniref:Cyb5r1 protein n=1 Tax=Symbiodinium natans TaxID=878477 RepID=A0A812UBQ7_9DINO|nr:cyb5r1 [Symbiodinium natans]